MQVGVRQIRFKPLSNLYHPDMNAKLKAITEKLNDERSKKILFVSHCILNENTRYLGGAFYSGINSDVLTELHKLNYGIVQLPCPEQIAWGGVLKRFIWAPIGSKGKPVNIFFKILFPLFLLYTKWQYSRLAAKTVSQMEDYLNSGFEIMGLIGVDGSPSCGVLKTLNLKKSFQYISELSIDTLNREEYNSHLYDRCMENGKGLFIKILSKKLDKKGIKIKVTSINIQNEMDRSKENIKH